MPTLELTVDQLRDIKEALEFRVSSYKVQKPLPTKKGMEWIERYETRLKEIYKKIEDVMKVQIFITFNGEKGVYDWAEDYYDPIWRRGLKDIEDTKKWLKNEKFMNPHMVFIELDNY
jgi:ABC-type Fe3+-hydroxamate transport system substrate-binding protein